MARTLVKETNPAGVVLPYAGGAAPIGWLLCDGSPISRTVYSSLFASIGTQYGIGDGSTTFNLPDLRGRAVAGKDDMGGIAANRLTAAGSGITATGLGNSGGSQTHTLTTAQMPAHTHGYTVIAIGGSGNSISGGGSWYQNASNTGSAGSTSAHNNTQPTIILNYIIKA